MRRPIDSDYIRKRRYSRRAKDNWRKVKIKKHEVKMYSDRSLWIAGITLLIMWALTITWMIWDAFR